MAHDRDLDGKQLEGTSPVPGCGCAECCSARMAKFRENGAPEGQIVRTSALGYPDNNPKTMMGALKPGIMGIPAAALYWLGAAFRDGITKYGLYNWREKRVSSSVYFEAINRHVWLWWDGETFSADTVAKGKPVHHLAHVMACCAIILDAETVDNLNDDRGPPGKLSALIDQMMAEIGVKAEPNIYALLKRKEAPLDGGLETHK